MAVPKHVPVVNMDVPDQVPMPHYSAEEVLNKAKAQAAAWEASAETGGGAVEAPTPVVSGTPSGQPPHDDDRSTTICPGART